MNKTKHTIVWWLSRIKDPEIRRKALHNMQNPEYEYDSLSRAIHGSFTWGNSPEKHNYWNDLYCKWCGNEKEHMVPEDWADINNEYPIY